MRNSNIDTIHIELLEATFLELHSDFFSSGSNTVNTGSLGQSQGSNNPGIADSYLSSDQPSDPGSNNNGNVDPVRDFETRRRAVGQKLRDLYVNKPPRFTIMMNHPNYSDRINVWDHNVVCRSVLDASSPLNKHIVIVGESTRYGGPLTIGLLGILER